MSYRYGEDIAMKVVSEYVASTYSGHYSGVTQPMDLISAAGKADGYCVGNIIKYASRYGRKEGRNRADILKIIHYAMMLLHLDGHLDSFKPRR